jgi:hypothetical protein
MSDVAMVVPSIVPPLMSVVVNTELASVTTPVESAIEPAAVPSLAFKFVTSMFVVSTVVALTLVMLPVVEVSVVIVVAAIVPPSTLSPEIWSSAKVSVPAETSRVLPAPTVISEVAMVAPSIVPPLMSAVSATKLSMFAVPSM